jgi:hypothetical protein
MFAEINLDALVGDVAITSSGFVGVVDRIVMEKDNVIYTVTQKEKKNSRGAEAFEKTAQIFSTPYKYRDYQTERMNKMVEENRNKVNATIAFFEEYKSKLAMAVAPGEGEE